MKGFQRELLHCALIAYTALTAACTSPGYNDNPSQQITNANIGCLAATDFFALYFSVRIQPSNGRQDPRITKEVFRSYCNDIPNPGAVFFTADLVGTELKRIPIGIRVVEEESGDDERQADNVNILRTISEVPAKTYANGVIETQFELNKSGYYAIYLFRGGKDAVSEGDTLKIPLTVEAGSNAKFFTPRFIALFGTTSGLALIGFVAYSHLRSRNAI